MTTCNASVWWKWLVCLALVAAASPFAWNWYTQRAKVPPPDYKTATATRGDIVQTVTANGAINAVTNVTVGSQVSGIITEVCVDFNSHVTNGQRVAQIDPSTYQQNINQTEADLASAQAGLELAQLNYRRAASLRTNELISIADHDKAVAELHQAEATVKTREASLKKAQVDLQRTTIYAPVDGIVISRAIDIGQTVAASFSTPTLFNIVNDLHKMRIEAMVSEADVGGVEEGQPVTFTVDAFQNRQFTGQVTQVRFAPITNQNVVNYISVIGVANPDLKLRPGMTANASIITAQRNGVLRIPNAALRFRPSTNAPPTAGLTNAPGGATAAAGGGRGNRPEGMPTPPWAAENRRPTPEERQAWTQSLTPEQRQQMERWREARAQAGEGPGGGSRGPGGSARASQEGPVTRTVYLIQKGTNSTAEAVSLKPITIKAGISDTSFTEVIEGLNEGDVVATGINRPMGTAAITTPAPGGSPFGGPFGGGMRPR